MGCFPKVIYFLTSNKKIDGDDMRIGKFAESNKISIDTIRHYMEFGLIIPEKKGSHYHFDGRARGIWMKYWF